MWLGSELERVLASTLNNLRVLRVLVRKSPASISSCRRHSLTSLIATCRVDRCQGRESTSSLCTPNTSVPSLSSVREVPRLHFQLPAPLSDSAHRHVPGRPVPGSRVDVIALH